MNILQSHSIVNIIYGKRSVNAESANQFRGNTWKYEEHKSYFDRPAGKVFANADTEPAAKMSLSSSTFAYLDSALCLAFSCSWCMHKYDSQHREILCSKIKHIVEKNLFIYNNFAQCFSWTNYPKDFRRKLLNSRVTSNAIIHNFVTELRPMG
jgi:hypothetical protein